MILRAAQHFAFTVALWMGVLVLLFLLDTWAYSQLWGLSLYPIWP
jgi:hypothetical protein